jgi:hypothetical protein
MEFPPTNKPLGSLASEAGINTNPLGHACKVFFRQNQFLLAFGAKESILRIEKLKRTRLKETPEARRKTDSKKNTRASFYS